MPVTDPIADMLTRIRNATMVGHRQVVVPASKLKLEIVRILKEEGFISGYRVIQQKPQPVVQIYLKYVGERRHRRPVIHGLKRVSKPGRRIYVKRDEIPWVRYGMGIAVLSTSRGVLTDRQARKLGVGGEVLCYIW